MDQFSRLYLSHEPCDKEAIIAPWSRILPGRYSTVVTSTRSETCIFVPVSFSKREFDETKCTASRKIIDHKAVANETKYVSTLKSAPGTYWTFRLVGLGDRIYLCCLLNCRPYRESGDSGLAFQQGVNSLLDFSGRVHERHRLSIWRRTIWHELRIEDFLPFKDGSQPLIAHLNSFLSVQDLRTCSRVGKSGTIYLVRKLRLC